MESRVGGGVEMMKLPLEGGEEMMEVMVAARVVGGRRSPGRARVRASLAAGR